MLPALAGYRVTMYDEASRCVAFLMRHQPPMVMTETRSIRSPLPLCGLPSWAISLASSSAMECPAI